MSPYDPDGQFSMSFLTRLEAAGIKVMTTLRKHTYAQLQSIDIEKILTDAQISTWAALLNFIINVLKLRDLGQQIEDYLTGKTDLAKYFSYVKS